MNQMLVSKGLQSFIIIVLSRENGTLCSLCVAITIQSVFCIVYFEAVAPGLDDASNNLLKYADVPRTTSQKT